MKKSILAFVLSITSSILLQAQSPVITESSYPVAGDSYNGKYLLNTADFNPGPSGANRSWDFSALPANSTLSSPVAYEAPASTPEGASFPTADVAVSYVGSYLYYDYSTSKIDIVGTVNGSVPSPYVDPQTVIVFPVNYQDTFKDTARTAPFASGSDTQTRTTYSETVADGYGSILLPDGISYPNVLRIRITTETIDSTFDASDAFQTRSISIDTQYYWIAPDQKPHVLSLLKHQTDGGAPVVIYQYFSSNTTGVWANHSSNALFSVYPNPAQSFFRVEIKDARYVPGQLSVTLMAPDGREILHKPLGGITSDISLQGLKQGLYYYQIQDAGQVLETGKLTVE